MPNKELNSFYKKLSKSNNTKTMSYTNGEIVLDCALDEIKVPSGYTIEDGNVMKDGVVSIGRISYNETKKEDSPTSILNTLASALEDDEDIDEDIDEEEIEEVVENIDSAFVQDNDYLEDSAFVVHEDDMDDTDFIEEENIFDKVYVTGENNKKSLKRGKRMAQFISYKFSSKKDYVEADNRFINNYISKEEHDRIVTEIIASYQEKVASIDDYYKTKLLELEKENNMLRVLSDELKTENDSLKKTRRKRNSAKTC